MSTIRKICSKCFHSPAKPVPRACFAAGRWTIAFRRSERRAGEQGSCNRYKTSCSERETIGSRDPAPDSDSFRSLSPTKSSPVIRSSTNCCKPCAGSDLAFEPGDILVVKHKIVSKAEGRVVDLDNRSSPLLIRLPGRSNTTSMPASSSLLAREPAHHPAQERRADHRDASRFYLRQQRRGRL